MKFQLVVGQGGLLRPRQLAGDQICYLRQLEPFIRA